MIISGFIYIRSDLHQACGKLFLAPSVFTQVKTEHKDPFKKQLSLIVKKSCHLIQPIEIIDKKPHCTRLCGIYFLGF